MSGLHFQQLIQRTQGDPKQQRNTNLTRFGFVVTASDAVYLGKQLRLEVNKRHSGFTHPLGRDSVTGEEFQGSVKHSLS